MVSKNNKKFVVESIVLVFFAIIVGITTLYNTDTNTLSPSNITYSINIDDVPKYTSAPYVVINNNIPNFTENDYTTNPFEKYSELDDLGRCGVAYANICKEIIPSKNEEREAIGSIKPSGWQTIRYNELIDGNYLYNRCHLIGYQLAGENANKKNLITGTRYMNVNGMLPFENMVADYIKKNQNNHILYRVTPIFKKNNLVANGVQIEAYSIEDNGSGVCFNVYIYNVQPGISIDYSNGNSTRKN